MSGFWHVSCCLNGKIGSVPVTVLRERMHEPRKKSFVERAMSLCFYAEQQTPSAQKLYRRLARLQRGGKRVTVNRVSNVESVADLKIGIDDVVVLYAGSVRELDALLRKRDLFADCRVILVLPDNGEETLHKGYMLRPRFVDFLDGDQSDLIKVVRNVVACDGDTRTATTGKPGEEQ